MGVGPEEGLVCPCLVPPDHKLGIGILEESADVCPGKGEPCSPDRQEHRNGGFQVFPVRFVITGPDSAVPLGPSKECPGKHERAGVSVYFPAPMALGCGPVLVPPVEVMPFPVFRSIDCFRVLLHGNLRPIED